jgi:transposase
MDEKIARMDVAVEAAASEGELDSSTLSTVQDDEAVAPLVPGQRWSLSRKREVVLPRQARRGPLLPPWSTGVEAGAVAQRALTGIDGGLRERDDPQERKLVGELSMEDELLRARLEKPGPLRPRWSR